MPKQKEKAKSLPIIPEDRIVGKIYLIRGEKVMFDRDLAALYGVKVRTLNQAVRRNIKRFPDDFMFQLNKQESDLFLRFQNGTSNSDSTFSRFQFGTLNENLKSQIVTSKKAESSRSQIVILKRGSNIKYFPFVFTEQGIAMLSSVLHSDRAIQVNIQIMRTFTQMRKMLISHKELREKIEKMERKYDGNFRVIFDVIKRLLKSDPKDSELKIIGFREKK